MPNRCGPIEQVHERAEATEAQALARKEQAEAVEAKAHAAQVLYQRCYTMFIIRSGSAVWAFAREAVQSLSLTVLPRPCRLSVLVADKHDAAGQEHAEAKLAKEHAQEERKAANAVRKEAHVIKQTAIVAREEAIVAHAHEEKQHEFTKLKLVELQAQLEKHRCGVAAPGGVAPSGTATEAAPCFQTEPAVLNKELAPLGLRDRCVLGLGGAAASVVVPIAKH